MIIPNQIKCDNCPVMKTEESNGWFSLTVDASTPWELHIRNSIIMNDNRGTLKHFCSEKCLIEQVKRNIPGTK